MSDQEQLSPKDEEILFNELLKDEKFLKARKLLLVFLGISGVILFLCGWYMFQNKISLLDFLTVFAIFGFGNMYLNKRIKDLRDETLNRLKRLGQIPAPIEPVEYVYEQKPEQENTEEKKTD